MKQILVLIADCEYSNGESESKNLTAFTNERAAVKEAEEFFRKEQAVGAWREANSLYYDNGSRIKLRLQLLEVKK